MPNLEAKFTELQDQLTAQNTGVQNSLDAILAALGAPPPTATVTLGTVSAQLTALNNNLIGIAIANGSFHSALLLAIAGMRTDLHAELASIGVQLDTITNNNSLNAQRMLAMMLATACPCETEAPLLPPIIDITPTVHVDEAKCRRIQFYLALFGDWLTRIASYGATGANINGDVLGYLLASAGAAAGLSATGAEIGAAAGIPGAVVGAVVGLLVAAAYAVGGSVLVDYATAFNAPTLQDNLLMALYNANSADEGQIAFESVVSAEFSNIPAGIINALWYTTWSNEVYASTPIIDDSAFDGSICGTVEELECFDQAATQIDSGFGLRWAIFLDTEYLGWTVNIIESGITVHIYGDGDPTRTIDTGPYVLTSDNINTGPNKFWFSNQDDGYTVHICPPE